MSEDNVFDFQRDWVDKGKHTPRHAGVATITYLGAPGNDPYANKALTEEIADLAGCPPGSRNHQLNRSAFSLASLVAAGRLQRDDTIGTLIATARQSGLPDSEIMPTIRSAFRGSDAKVGPRVVPELKTPKPDITIIEADSQQTVSPGHTNDVPGEDADQKLAETLSHFTDGASFILDIPETVPAIWGEGSEILWMEGESLMIAGPMGLGKTTLGGQLMRAQLGIGDPTVLDLPVKPAAGRILYLAMDRPAQAARALARQFDHRHRDLLAERLVVWQGPPPSDIAKYPGLLVWLAEQAEADVVYLDSVKDAAIGLSEDEVGAGYNRARQQLLASGRQLAELHHTTKRGANGGPPKDVADIYGSTWITNGTGSIILLSGQPGDPIVGMAHVRQPIEEVGPYRLLHEQSTGAISVHHQTDLLALVTAAGADGVTAKDAAAALIDDEGATPTRGQIEKARRKLDALTDQGILRRINGDKSKSQPAVWFVGGGVSFND